MRARIRIVDVVIKFQWANLQCCADHPVDTSLDSDQLPKKKKKKNNPKFVEAYSNSFDREYKIMDAHDFKTNIQIVHSTVDDHSKRQNSIFWHI